MLGKYSFASAISLSHTLTFFSLFSWQPLKFPTECDSPNVDMVVVRVLHSCPVCSQQLAGYQAEADHQSRILFLKAEASLSSYWSPSPELGQWQQRLFKCVMIRKWNWKTFNWFEGEHLKYQKHNISWKTMATECMAGYLQLSLPCLLPYLDSAFFEGGALGYTPVRY